MSKKIPQLLTFVLASTFALSSYAAACQLTVVNNLANTSSQGPQGPYYLQTLKVNGGSCVDGTCPAQVQNGQSVSIKNNGTDWDTVLTSSVYQSSAMNVGSIRVEIQNATTTCSPVNVYSDYCSTDPASGKSNCKIVGTQSGNTVTLSLQMN